VADKRCDNGHFIDEAWDICPYCPADASEPHVQAARPRAMDPVTTPMTAPVTIARSNPAANAPANPPAPSPAPRPQTAPGRGVAAAVEARPMERTVAASKLDPSKIETQKRYVVGWLVALTGSSRGEAFSVRMGRNTIGRDRGSDVVINDDQASQHHADLIFRPEERRFILMDHNSTNGTYVNESEIEPRRDLATNDVIRIGSHRLLFTPLCHEGFHWDDEGLLK
jgi:hypothetical protein